LKVSKVSKVLSNPQVIKSFNNIQKGLKKSALLTKLVFIPFLLVFVVPISYGLMGGKFNGTIFIVMAFLLIFLMVFAFYTHKLRSKIIRSFKVKVTKPILADYKPEWKLDEKQGLDEDSILTLKMLRQKYGHYYSADSVTGKVGSSFFHSADITLSTTYNTGSSDDSSSETVTHYEGRVFMMELGDVIMTPIHLYSDLNSNHFDSKDTPAFYSEKGQPFSFEESRFTECFTVFSDEKGFSNIFDDAFKSELVGLRDFTRSNIRIVMSGAKMYIALEGNYQSWNLSNKRTIEEVNNSIKVNIELLEYLVAFSESFTQRVFQTKDIWHK
jgi:hypothetical protein